MADRTIGELPVADHLDDKSLLVVEQQGEARSIQGKLVRRFAEVATEESVRAAQVAAEQAEQSAQNAADSAAQAEAFGAAAAGSAAQAEGSAASAAIDADAAADSAAAAESWAQGGTGTRPGEDTDNAEYWASRAQAYAQQASVPPVQGVYNVVLTDNVTGGRYALVVNNGVLTLLGVSDTLESTNMTLVDGATGVAYDLIVESGVLKIEEVS